MSPTSSRSSTRRTAARRPRSRTARVRRAPDAQTAPPRPAAGTARRWRRGSYGRDTRPMFVGRTSELTTLERALAAAHAGSGATVLVAGEAGIGKTRLAAELATRSGDAGFVALLGRSIDFA